MDTERDSVAEIVGAVPRLPELSFTAPVNWTIQAGEQWAVIGPNGAGKSLLVDLLQRKFALKAGEVNFAAKGRVSDFVRCITFKDIYVTAPRMPQSGFRGFDEEHQSRDITIDGLYLNGKRIERIEDANINIGKFTSNISFK